MLSGILRDTSKRGATRKNHRDKPIESVSFSDLTLESQMSFRGKEMARKDMIDEGSDVYERVEESWFCYRLILAGLLAVFVCITCFMASCQSFKYTSWDDEVFYYGIRGVTDQSTGRCIGWEIQELIDWNDYWTGQRLPMLFKMGITGISFVVGIFLTWLVYGRILKSKRDMRRIRADNPSESGDRCGGPIGPAVIIGVCIIGAGLLVFVTIMGNCSNIPPIAGYSRGLNCNLHTLSALALSSSIILCCMGGSLACFLKCCCYRCRMTTYLRNQLIDSS